MAQEPGSGPRPPEAQGVPRRGFLRDAVVVTAGALGGGGAVAAVLGGRPEHAAPPQDVIKPDQLTQEQREALQNRVWGGLTEVLQEGLFSKDSLNIEQLALQKKGLLRGEDQTRIEGSVRGNSRQVGVHFSIDYGKEPVTPEEKLRLDIPAGEGAEGKSVVLGEQKGQLLEIGYFMGENAGDVRVPALGARKTPQDVEGMKKRFEDSVDILKKHLKVPQDAPFVPDQDFDGLTTFVNNRTGYGLFIDSPHDIDGKTVTFHVKEGLLADESAWKDTYFRNSMALQGVRRRIDARRISFGEVLRSSLESLNHGANRDYWNRTAFKEAPAKEYINNLARKYPPQEMVGEAKRG